MDRPKTLPGTIRRRKRNRGAASKNRQQEMKVALAIMGLLVGLAWTLGLLWFSLSMKMKEKNNSASPQGVINDYSDQPPPFIIKLWPSDASATELQDLWTDCPECPPKQDGSPERVLVVRPPGQFSDIMSEFVKTYLDGSAMEITSWTAPLDEPFPEEYDVVIHVATLPLLLEAFDVLLGAAEPIKALLTQDDILAVVQHLVKWHCRVAAQARQTRSMVLTLDPTISYPLYSEKKLESLYNQTNVPIPRNEFARKTLTHIDESTTFWTALMSKGMALRGAPVGRRQESDLPARALALIRETMNNGKCPEPNSETANWFSMSAAHDEKLLESLWESTLSGEVMDEN